MGTNGSTRYQKEERRLEVKLTEVELIKRGDQMADAELEIESLKEKRKALNVAIQNAAGLRAELAHAIERGTEEQPVQCEWRPDYPKNVFRLIRLDTNEEVDTRAMTAEDRNAALPFGASGKSDDEDPPPPRSPKPRTRKAAKAKPHLTAV
jgi:FtsZ-binding cell division protein ZapB